MSEEQAIQKLKDVQQNPDIEAAHGQADDILCQLLISLGYADVVAEYRKVRKWYA